MEKAKKVLQKPLVLLLASALLSALPLSFPSLFLLSWVSFVPFFLVLLRKRGEGSALGAIGRGVFFGFFYHFFVYFWFLWLYPLDFAGLNRIASLCVVLLAWIGISLIHGLLYALPTLLCHLLSKRFRSAPFLLFSAILAILLAERLTETSELAFPWVRLALGQYRATALIQSASLFGMEGLEFLILSVSALITLAPLWEKKRRLLALSLAGGIFAANLLFGALRLWTSPKGGEGLFVTSVQGNILSGEKWDGGNTALETYVSLTEGGVDEACGLVVWPESAVTSNLYENETLLTLYQALSEKVDAPLLTGCFWKKGTQSTNSAILLDGESVSEPYSKQILVPFGERMPYRKLLSSVFPFLTQINMLSDDLAPGTDSALMELDGKRIGSVICFESVFPDLVRKSVRDGAELLVIVTNDSWYEDSPAVWQHLAQAVFRSVENHRSVVRCANSGVSAFIDEKGQILSELGPLQQGTLSSRVTYSEETTLFSLTGSLVFPVGSAVFGLWLTLLILRERRRGV